MSTLNLLPWIYASRTKCVRVYRDLKSLLGLTDAFMAAMTKAATYYATAEGILVSGNPDTATCLCQRTDNDSKCFYRHAADVRGSAGRAAPPPEELVPYIDDLGVPVEYPDVPNAMLIPTSAGQPLPAQLAGRLDESVDYLPGTTGPASNIPVGFEPEPQTSNTKPIVPTYPPFTGSYSAFAPDSYWPEHTATTEASPSEQNPSITVPRFAYVYQDLIAYQGVDPATLLQMARNSARWGAAYKFEQFLNLLKTSDLWAVIRFVVLYYQSLERLGLHSTVWAEYVSLFRAAKAQDGSYDLYTQLDPDIGGTPAALVALDEADTATADEQTFLPGYLQTRNVAMFNICDVYGDAMSAFDGVRRYRYDITGPHVLPAMVLQPVLTGTDGS